MAYSTLPEFGCGPAMRALNERQRAFVLATLEMGAGAKDKNGWRIRACRAAGYEGTEKYLYVQAHRLAHDPKVMLAMKEVALGRMSSEAVPLTALLLDIAYGDIPSTPTEKMKAAAMIFNRIGMPETTEHKVSVTHDVSTDDAMMKLTKFAKVLNLDPQQLLGHVGVQVVDGEFTEVEPAKLEFQPDEFAV